MRISDWSSDVCSSDLEFGTDGVVAVQATDDEATAVEVDDPRLAAIAGRAVAAQRHRAVRVRRRLVGDHHAGGQRCVEAAAEGVVALPLLLDRRLDRLRRIVAVDLGNEGEDARFRRFRRSEEHTSELQSLMRISYA